MMLIVLASILINILVKQIAVCSIKTILVIMVFFMFNIIEVMVTNMKEKKTHQVGVRLSDSQIKFVDTVVSNIGLKNRSEGLQYLINKMRFLDVK
ncbi:hypothetical protein [Edaphovirga cremea]|uniref:hypothetical protein n=1 Tax=Edaphovirga cremea TaxID=2267246 RepID=UPI000DEF4D33|nr:hypothetical protein [Edaphovirga cremea]